MQTKTPCVNCKCIADVSSPFTQSPERWTHCTCCGFETYFHEWTGKFQYRSNLDINAGFWHDPPPGTLLIVREEPV